MAELKCIEIGRPNEAQYIDEGSKTNEINRVTLNRMRFFACAQNDALFVMLNAVKHLTLDRR